MAIWPAPLALTLIFTCAPSASASSSSRRATSRSSLLRRGGLLLGRVELVLHQALGLAHRIALGGNAVGELHLAGLGQRQQRAGVAHVDLAGHEQVLHRLGEVQQAQQVAGGGTRAADGVGRLLVGHAEFVDEALDAHRLLERVEVLALDVLDERHGERGLVGNLAHQHRHFVQAGELRSAPAPFAGDDLVAAAVDRAHQDRLHDALRLDRGGQLVQRLLVHVRARLVLAGLQVVDAQGVLAPAARCCCRPAGRRARGRGLSVW
jgi:hypothetical protein